ncbi:MAG: 4Fe-4S dicluster domain-containing protein [Gammaproteobacteria bacterium]
MNAADTQTVTDTARYDTGFLREIETHVGQGEWLKMCTQCGACAGACPSERAGGHSPQSLFMLVRAGQRETVLSSGAPWDCLSCGDCGVQCPSRIPVANILAGLAHYAEQLGLAPREHPNRVLALACWDNIERHGRINEAELETRLKFRDGFAQGINRCLNAKDLAVRLIKAERLAPKALGSLIGLNFGHRGVKEKSGLRKILAKARALEAARAKEDGGD